MPNKDNSRPVAIKYSGTSLLEVPLLNKGSAFTEEERDTFNLRGLLPASIETIETQVQRSYSQYSSFRNDIDKHIYLRNLQDTNETVFYRLVTNHLTEMLPIIYTPVVGDACEHFSEIYRSARGLFISYPRKHLIDKMLSNVTKNNVKVIVVTDGERILGLGDQGIGGMGIPVGKLSLYTACGGISPAYTLPIVLDVGTNNERLLNDPLYLGWKHPRITGEEYNEFVDEFIKAVKRRWPNVLLQFEDFAQKNASPILQRYRKEICCFNDDIQGTAAVALGTLISAARATGRTVKEQKVVFLGAGSAGCGIAEQIIARMVEQGLTEKEARKRIFMVDRYGLLTDQMPNMLDFQAKLAQKSEDVKDWKLEKKDASLLETIQHVKPTVLIGVSGQPGLFTEKVITAMFEHCENPIIMPLSNPTSRVEALPQDIIRWTKGKAIVATGSPFLPVLFEEKSYPIAQCNNSYIFPGLGLGVIASKATEITDAMFMAASEALADFSPLATGEGTALLPDLGEIQKVSKGIAIKVAEVAQKEGVAPKMTLAELTEAIEENFWKPAYRNYIPKQK